jgi:hypothetical protein
MMFCEAVAVLYCYGFFFVIEQLLLAANAVSRAGLCEKNSVNSKTVIKNVMLERLKKSLRFFVQRKPPAMLGVQKSFSYE